MQFDDVLRTFARFFEAEHIRYAVIGGLALQAWGYSRFTRDVDFVVECAGHDRVVAFVESLMKAMSMKNSPQRVLVDSPDVQFLLRLPGVDRAAVRDYFARHGLLELFDAIERQS